MIALADHRKCFGAGLLKLQGTLVLILPVSEDFQCNFHTMTCSHKISGVLVAYEGLPLHLALFPKLWTELCQTQVRVRKSEN